MTISECRLLPAVTVAGGGMFVGRAGELAVLAAAASAARCGQPQVVLVRGRDWRSCVSEQRVFLCGWSLMVTLSYYA